MSEAEKKAMLRLVEIVGELVKDREQHTDSDESLKFWHYLHEIEEMKKSFV